MYRTGGLVLFLGGAALGEVVGKSVQGYGTVLDSRTKNSFVGAFVIGTLGTPNEVGNLVCLIVCATPGHRKVRIAHYGVDVTGIYSIYKAFSHR